MLAVGLDSLFSRRFVSFSSELDPNIQCLARQLSVATFMVQGGARAAAYQKELRSKGFARAVEIGFMMGGGYVSFMTEEEAKEAAEREKLEQQRLKVANNESVSCPA
jgi:hypothetical protein